MKKQVDEVWRCAQYTDTNRGFDMKQELTRQSGVDKLYIARLPERGSSRGKEITKEYSFIHVSTVTNRGASASTLMYAHKTKE